MLGFRGVPATILAAARHMGMRGYREGGRGYVVVHLLSERGPDTWRVGYTRGAAVVGWEPFTRAVVADLTHKIATYDPAKSVIVILLDATDQSATRTAIMELPPTMTSGMTG